MKRITPQFLLTLFFCVTLMSCKTIFKNMDSNYKAKVAKQKAKAEAQNKLAVTDGKYK